MQACHHFYDPTEAEPQFVVCFEQDERHEHKKRAGKVIAHLKSLDVDVLAEQSVLFFKWIVLHRLSPEFQPYTGALLGFFHSKGLLTGKKTVINPVKQLKGRYLVMYTMGHGDKQHTFARTYNSIRELKTDTGKKPSQIKRQKIKDVMCSPLKPSACAAPHPPP